MFYGDLMGFNQHELEFRWIQLGFQSQIDDFMVLGFTSDFMVISWSTLTRCHESHQRCPDHWAEITWVAFSPYIIQCGDAS